MRETKEQPQEREIYSKGGFPGGSEVKASACNVGDPGSIPGLGRSPGEGNGNPLQYSCLENPMDGGAWWAPVHSVAKSRTRLSQLLEKKWGTGHTRSLSLKHLGPSGTERLNK